MLDPKLIAQIEIQKNWPKFGNIRTSCTFYSVGEDSYNTDTRDVTLGAKITIPNLFIIFDEFPQTRNNSQFNREDDIEILSIDRVAMFPFLDLVDGTTQIKAKVDDIIYDGETTWLVKGKGIDPTEALYSLHVRPTKPEPKPS